MLRRVIQGPYRIGPWPGLSASGALVLLGCAALIAASEALIGSPVAVLGVSALLPMALATRIVNTPGAASAVAGAYLLPRTLLTLGNPGLALPPLLLIPAFAFDVALWLRWRDLKRGGSKQRIRRDVTWSRAVFAGALFSLVLATVQPPGDVLAGLASVAASSLAALVSVRGTAR